MATSDELNVGELPSFSVLKPFEQTAIVLRAEGKSYLEILNHINTEYSLAYKQRAIEEWFYAGGRLVQAYLEYNTAVADQAVETAKMRIKKSSDRAAQVLDELMGEQYDPKIRVHAAKAVLGKFVPDRQVVFDGGGDPDNLPDGLADEMDSVVKEEGVKTENDNPPTDTATP